MSNFLFYQWRLFRSSYVLLEMTVTLETEYMQYGFVTVYELCKGQDADGITGASLALSRSQ